MTRTALTLRILPAVMVLLCITAGMPASEGPPDARPVLFMLGEGFNGDEFYQPYFALTAVGYRVVIAGAEEGPVKSPYDDRDLDVNADVALADVNAEDYLAMIIPGGHGPENLEEYPEALEICRAFMEADKPVSAICHGPRLLMQAGLLEDRAFTSLWRIKDELPDLWTSGERGAYVDKAVVEDGNLITSRYPWDTPAFTRRTRRKLAEAAGHEFDERRPRIAVINPRPDRLDRWAYLGALPAAGAKIEDLPLWRVERFIDAEDYDPGQYQLLLVLSGGQKDELVEHEHVRRLIDSFADADVGVAVVGDVYDKLVEAGIVGDDVLRPDGSHGEIIGELLTEALRDMPAEQPAQPKPATAAIALDNGFDGRVFAAMKAHLEYKGHEVLVIGPEAGWIRGINGTPAEVQATYDDANLAEDAVIVAPGGLWPGEHMQTDTRIDWLLERHGTGATIVAFGFDSLYIGRREQFDGKSFATTAQVRWAFQGAGSYTEDPAVVTTERLITAKGFEQVADALKLLD